MHAQKNTLDPWLHSLMPSEVSWLLDVQQNRALWMPQSKPQWEAALSRADEIYYGGAAGGGKSSLVLGLAITAHQDSIVFRRELTQLRGATGLIEESRKVIGQSGRYNGLEHTWRDLPGGRALEFGACQYDQDKHKYQGRPHDFIGFDELPEFLESQYRFLGGWLRTVVEGQRCRIICAGNPPMHSDGQWVIDYWAPWLSEHHPNPAQPGELRWFAIVDGKNVEVEERDPFDHNGQIITPRSRTFIPARLADNPYLADTDYGTVLNNLPEPLRTQLLFGDFTVGVDDDPWQVIPTEWVRLAQQRWKERVKPDTPLSAMGVDVARGGNDQTAACKRYDTWFSEIAKRSGRQTPDGPSVKLFVLQELDGEAGSASINVDVIGVGSSAYDSLVYHEAEGGYLNVVGVNFAAGTKARDRSGMLAMRNVRAEAYWGFREALDPQKGDDLALPDDPELLADLVAAKWRLSASGIQIESKDEIKARLGRSPDCGDAVVLAHYGSYGGSLMTLL
jgi:hypothetical protein